MLSDRPILQPGKTDEIIDKNRCKSGPAYEHVKVNIDIKINLMEESTIKSWETAAPASRYPENFEIEINTASMLHHTTKLR